MDRKLHDLIHAVQALGPDQRSLQRAAARVEQADRQLHYALSAGDTSPDRGRQVIQRQAQALLAEARELQRATRYALTGPRQVRQLDDDLARLVDAAEHFTKSVAQRQDPEHLRGDFRDVRQAWERVTAAVNALPPAEGNSYLRRRAQQVDAVYDLLFAHLRLEGNRPRIILSPYRTG
jgi:hypothetical protein